MREERKMEELMPKKRRLLEHLMRLHEQIAWIENTSSCLDHLYFLFIIIILFFIYVLK